MSARNRQPSSHEPCNQEAHSRPPAAAADQAGGDQTEEIEYLLEHPHLWRAGRMDTCIATTPTGHAALDGPLGGGWPRHGLTELLIPTAGIGELRLLLPLMHTLTREQNRLIAWVDPPFLPYAPALEAAGIDLGRVLLIHSRSHGEALWALERACRSGHCSLVLAWLDEHRLEPADTRRLQVAAHRGSTFTALFRPDSAAARPSMAALRLRLRPDLKDGALLVDILKRRGGWPVSDLQIRLEQAVRSADLQACIDRWRLRRQQPQPVARAYHDRHFPARAGTPPIITPPAQQIH